MPVTERTTRTYTCDICGKKEDCNDDGRAVMQGWDNVVINNSEHLWLCSDDSYKLQQYLIRMIDR